LLLLKAESCFTEIHRDENFQGKEKEIGDQKKKMERYLGMFQKPVFNEEKTKEVKGIIFNTIYTVSSFISAIQRLSSSALT